MAVKCLVNPTLTGEQLKEAVEKLYDTYKSTGVLQLEINCKGTLFCMVAVYEDGVSPESTTKEVK